MAGGLYLEVKLAGTAVVATGAADLVLLEEELDHAAQVTVRLVCSGASGELISEARFGAEFTLEMGLGTSPSRTVRCKVVETEDEYDGQGDFRFVMRGVDELVRLKHTTRSRLFEVSPGAALQQMISDMGWTAALDGVDSYTQPLLQNNETDASFMRRLARAGGYTMTLDDTQLRMGRAPDTTRVTLGPADGLIRVRIRRSILDIPSQVSVVGYDWKSTQGPVQGQAGSADLANISGGTTAAELVQQTWGTVEHVVESERLLQQGDATASARGALQDRADRFVEGELECLGQPDARPGRLLVIEGVGSLDGTYRIRATRHQIDAATGFRTTIRFYSDSLPAEAA